MSKAFDTINIHTLIRKLLHTNIPGTIIKLIANYIKGRNAYTTYRNHTSRQRQFKTGVPQGGVLSPILFTLLTPDPAEYNTQLGLHIDNTILPMTTHPKILGLTLDSKLTYNRHIDLTATKARKTINILIPRQSGENTRKPYLQHTKP